jgi:rhodanese-related sulfurtransferase
MVLSRLFNILFLLLRHIKKFWHLMLTTCLLLCIPQHASVAEQVNITSEIPYLDVLHNGKKVRIERNQDRANIIDLDYALTSRPCPPYCIQPIQLAAGVETVAELEVLDYLARISKGNKSLLLIDSREKKWLSKGMIPAAINIPWQQLHSKTANPQQIKELLEFRFGVINLNGLWNFQAAKTLVFYCNGPWCGQSPTNIRALLALGYPANKLKWYRGGMQAWKSLGLTTVVP